MEETVEIKRPKLLLADDSITIRKVVELTFAEEGVDVFAVGDGEAAMQKFVEIQPDIVLVDVNMPDPDGYHICEMIKQDESTKDIPVLLLVGSFEPFDTAEAERVGADGFMTKPFQSVRDLIGKVTELLGDDDIFALPPAETEDIESLYSSSVSETYRGPDRTTDMLLGDAGMDDDLIEASYLAGGPEPEPLAAAADASLEESFQGYDWMAERVDTTEPLPVNGGSEEPPRETAIEMYEPEPEYMPEPAPEPQPEPAPQPELEPEPKRETAFDMYEPEPEPEPKSAEPQPEAPQLEGPAHFEGVVDEFADTLDVEEPRPEPAESGETTVERFTPYEPPEEFIDIIARRVMEKLSDKAVRDIARETVPRITEKLIREALDQEGKKHQS